MDFKTKSAITGFFGDIGLQLIIQKKGDLAGLKEYFKQHGQVESVSIATGLMFSVGYIYELTGLPTNIIYLGIYGASLDVLFRTSRIMPSLDSYYKALNPIQSMIWGAIPLIIPSLF